VNICLSVRLSVCPSVCLFVRPSVCLRRSVGLLVGQSVGHSVSRVAGGLGRGKIDPHTQAGQPSCENINVSCMFSVVARVALHPAVELTARESTRICRIVDLVRDSHVTLWPDSWQQILVCSIGIYVGCLMVASTSPECLSQSVRINRRPTKVSLQNFFLCRLEFSVVKNAGCMQCS